MRLLLALMFVVSSSLAIAEEVSTDCPWSNQDNRTSGKAVKAASAKTKGKSVKVKGE